MTVPLEVKGTLTPRRANIRVNVVKPEEISGQLVPVIKIPVGGNVTFTWNQNLALAVWTIPHNLNRFPSVTVVDTLGNRVESDVQYLDANMVQVNHGSALAGRAYLN